MRAVAVAAALGAAGCNQVFHLDQTSIEADAAPGTDEDGDGIANASDDCPGIFDPQQLDGDGDGVGDACDPHPTTPGDHIAFSEFFETTAYALVPDQPTSWMIGDGMLTTVGAPDSTDTRLTLQRTAQAPTVELGFTVLGYGTVTMGELDVTIAFPGNTGVCRVQAMKPSFPLDEVVTTANTLGQYTNDLPSAVNVGMPLVVTATREASTTLNGKCSVDATTTLIDPGPPCDFTNVTASIRAAGIQVALRYMLLYDVR